MNASVCPGNDLLRDYLSGRLDQGTHAVIDDHLDACAECQTTADGLERVTEDLFPRVAASAAVPAFDDPAFQEMVARAKALGGQSASADAVADGLVLGNYTLLEPLGAGGMGRVYKARHERMKRLVAVKILAPDLLRSAEARARFQREVEAARPAAASEHRGRVRRRRGGRS